MPLQEGQILEGKYQVDHLLARGGIGEVYLGVNRRLEKRVAIKVLHPDLANEPTVVRRFEQEARVAAMIRSAHIADVYDFGDLPSGDRFMVMELLEGENLGDRLERVERVSENALATIALEILDALSSAHEAGVVHRDLKPENVFLTTRDGRDFVKVVDFGISKIVAARKFEPRSLTIAGALLGTPLYMSPEQARGKTVDHRTDLYSLGVILYEAALGEPPFLGENVNDLLFRVALDDVTPLELRLPSVSPALAAIVKKAMARAPKDRFQSAAEMREAVLEWQAMFVSGSPTRASMPSLAGALAGHTSMPTPRPWSLTQPDLDETDEDIDLESILPRRRSKGRLVAFMTVCAVVALAVTYPQHVKTVSAEVALRAAPLWKAAGSKASAAFAPPPSTSTPPTVTEPVVTTPDMPAPGPPAATGTGTAPGATTAPKRVPPPRATVKTAAPEATKVEPVRSNEERAAEPAPEGDARPRAADTIL